MKRSPTQFNVKRGVQPRIRRVAQATINIRKDADVTTACHKILAFIKKVDRRGVVQVQINTDDGLQHAVHPAPAPPPPPPAPARKADPAKPTKPDKAKPAPKAARPPRSAKASAADLLA